MAAAEPSAAVLSPHQARLIRFKNLLNTDPSMSDVQRLCFDGIPDEEGLRAIYWRVLLGYLPLDTASWNDTLQRQRAQYYQIADEFIVEQPPSSLDDHPLAESSHSNWQYFFRDNELLVEIDRDVRRTLPSMALFQQPVGPPNPLAQGKRYGAIIASRMQYARKRSAYPEVRAATGTRDDDSEDGEVHWEVIRRLLFMYAKLNPGIRYVQGMNDIAAVIYYVMVKHTLSDWAMWAEPDAFFCFVALMSELRDGFVKSLDNSVTGIRAQIAQLEALLKRLDVQLWLNLNGKGLDPQYYAFRWLTLLMTHEFEVPDVIRLWDSLLADPNRFEFLLYFCCAMMIIARTELMRGDFAVCLSLLQNFQLSDLSSLLRLARSLRERDRAGAFG